MHAYDRERAEHKLRYNERLVETLLEQARRTPSRLTALQRAALDLAAYRHLLGTPGGVRESLRLAAEAGVLLFELAPQAGRPAAFTLGGGPAVEAASDVAPELADANAWHHAYLCTLLVRAPELRDRLCRQPLTLLRRPRADAQEYYYVYLDFLHRLWRTGEPDLELLLAAMRLTDPGSLPEETLDHALASVVPELELFYRGAEGDAEAFNAALVKNLGLHERFHARPGKADRPEAFLAWGQAAVAAWAHDRGVAITVSSDYLPIALIRNERF